MKKILRHSLYKTIKQADILKPFIFFLWARFGSIFTSLTWQFQKANMSSPHQKTALLL